MIAARKIVSWLLVLSLLVNVFNKAVVYYIFLIQKEYIIANLCEQRFEEENKCQGCCQLNKQLKKVSQEDEKDLPFPTTKVKEIREVLPIVTMQFAFDLYQSELPKSIQTDLYVYDFLSEIFRPPRISHA